MGCDILASFICKFVRKLYFLEYKQALVFLIQTLVQKGNPRKGTGYQKTSFRIGLQFSSDSRLLRSKQVRCKNPIADDGYTDSHANSLNASQIPLVISGV